MVADPIADPIWTGDFREKMDGIPDGSIGMIFVDPPYDKGSFDLYRDLAVHAKRVLREGGSLVTYNGQYALPDTLNLVTPELTYYWQLAIKHGGQATRMRNQGVFIQWKSLLWFVKGKRRVERYVFDFFQSKQPTKDLHDWEQDVSEAAYYIEHISEKEDIILDPMCGSGTTGVAAKGLGRKFIGIEIDEDRANVARMRWHECNAGLPSLAKAS